MEAENPGLGISAPGALEGLEEPPGTARMRAAPRGSDSKESPVRPSEGWGAAKGRCSDFSVFLLIMTLECFGCSALVLHGIPRRADFMRD